jgi:hypothetical protein
MFTLYDKSNNFYVKSTNLYFSFLYNNKNDYYNLVGEFRTGLNIEKINKKLSLFSDCFINLNNSTRDKIRIQLEKKKQEEATYGGILTEVVLIIECYGNIFLKSKFKNNTRPILSLQAKNSKYIFYDKHNEFRLDCNDFLFSPPFI